MNCPNAAWQRIIALAAEEKTPLAWLARRCAQHNGEGWVSLAALAEDPSLALSGGRLAEAICLLERLLAGGSPEPEDWR